MVRTNKRQNMMRIFWLPILMLGILFINVPLSGAQLESLSTGMRAPEFSRADLEGKEHSQDEFFKEGLTTVLLFWSPDNRKSPNALKDLEAIKQKYSDKPFILVTVAVHPAETHPEGVAPVKAMVDELGITSLVLVDSDRFIFYEFGVIALPTTVILDSDRTILYALAGYPLVQSEHMLEFLEGILTGRPQEEVVTPSGPKPDKSAVRNLNLARKTAKKRTMASMAGTYYQKAIDADPGFVLPYIEWYDLLQCEGDLEAARKLLEKAETSIPDHPQILTRKASLLIRENKLDDARLLLLEITEKHPLNPHGHYLLGHCLSLTGAYEEAEASFAKSIELNPYNPMIYEYRAKMNEGRGNREAAAEDFRTLSELLRKDE